MGLWIRGADKYYLQQFENSGGLIQDGLHAYDPPVLEQALEIMKRYVNDAESPRDIAKHMKNNI